MRVCLNLLAALTGGQLTRASAFLERFPSYAPDSKLIVLKERSVLNELQATDAFEIEQLSMGGLGRLRAIRRRSWEHIFLPSLMRRTRADVLLTFSHYLPINFPKSIPSVVGVANLAPFSVRAREAEGTVMRTKFALLKRSIISSAKRATKVIALSEACRNVLLEHDVPARNIIVIPNGVDKRWAQPANAPSVLAEHAVRRPYLLYVSHFYRYKDHATLIRAFAQLPTAIREAHQLVLVGKPHERAYFNELSHLRDELRLRDAIVMIPGESGVRLREIYQQSKLFVFPSLVENSPNSILEAMAAGAPVLASNVEPMPEFGGAAARYFEAGDAAALALQVAALLNDPAELEAMRARSRGRAGAFSWDAFVRGVVDICRETLSAPAAH